MWSRWSFIAFKNWLSWVFLKWNTQMKIFDINEAITYYA